MSKVFTANIKGKYQDFAEPEGAIAAIEDAGSGDVVLFNRSPNLPGCLPEYVDRSVSMWSFNLRGDGIWRGHYIFDGYGNPYCEERPH